MLVMYQTPWAYRRVANRFLFVPLRSVMLATTLSFGSPAVLLSSTAVAATPDEVAQMARTYHLDPMLIAQIPDALQSELIPTIVAAQDEMGFGAGSAASAKMLDNKLMALGSKVNNQMALACFTLTSKEWQATLEGNELVLTQGNTELLRKAYVVSENHDPKNVDENAPENNPPQNPKPQQDPPQAPGNHRSGILVAAIIGGGLLAVGLILALGRRFNLRSPRNPLSQTMDLKQQLFTLAQKYAPVIQRQTSQAVDPIVLEEYLRAMMALCLRPKSIEASLEKLSQELGRLKEIFSIAGEERPAAETVEIPRLLQTGQYQTLGMLMERLNTLVEAEIAEIDRQIAQENSGIARLVDSITQRYTTVLAAEGFVVEADQLRTHIVRVVRDQLTRGTDISVKTVLDEVRRNFSIPVTDPTEQDTQPGGKS